MKTIKEKGKFVRIDKFLSPWRFIKLFLILIYILLNER